LLLNELTRILARPYFNLAGLLGDDAGLLAALEDMREAALVLEPQPARHGQLQLRRAVAAGRARETQARWNIAPAGKSYVALKGERGSRVRLAGPDGSP